MKEGDVTGPLGPAPPYAPCSSVCCSAPAQLTFPAKLSMGDDIRYIQLVPGVSYMEIMEHVRQLYPSAGPFVLKYLDK